MGMDLDRERYIANRNCAIVVVCYVVGWVIAAYMNGTLWSKSRLVSAGVVGLLMAATIFGLWTLIRFKLRIRRFGKPKQS